MPHLVDYNKPLPFHCEDCAHYIDGFTCKAFDLIPIKIYGAPEKKPGKKVAGQKGDYVFEPKEGVERSYIRCYVVE